MNSCDTFELNAFASSAKYDDTPAEALAAFLYEAAPDDTGRTMATAMFVLSHWQMTCGELTSALPSVVLVNAGDSDRDPLDGFADEFIFRLNDLEQNLNDEGKEKNVHYPGDARKAMATAVLYARQLSKDHIYADRYRNMFHGYRKREHGAGPAHRYTRAWTEEYGWMSNSSNRMVLRLDQAGDRDLLRHDLLTHSDKLRNPKGLGGELTTVRKKLALSGSLHSAQWDEPVVTRLLTTGWPVLFLPHTVITPLRVENTVDLHLARMQLAAYSWQTRVTAEEVLPDDPWLQYHHRLLLGRLAHMPADYSFAVQRMVRKLGGICMRLAMVIGESFKVQEATILLGQDLFRLTLRAIVIGLFSLAYHGWGFDAGCPRTTVAAMLHHIRQHGPLSRRDLQRKFAAMNSRTRDEVVAKLVREGLLECEGRVVSAVPLSDFIGWLQQRPDFPKTGVLSSLLLGRKCLMADPLPGMEEQPRKRRCRRKTAPQAGHAPDTAGGVGKPNAGAVMEEGTATTHCQAPAA